MVITTYVGDVSSVSRVPRRRDARKNRERLLDTAESYFAEFGLNAPLQGLAAAAQVGAATLYRNFASHEELVRALFDRFVVEVDAVIEAGRAASTGWAGIESMVRGIVRIMIARPILAEVLRRQAMNDPATAASLRWVDPVTEVVERAKAEGSARPDLHAADLGVAPYVLSAMRNFAPTNREWISARMTALLLDGMRAHPHAGSVLPEVADGFLEPLRRARASDT